MSLGEKTKIPIIWVFSLVPILILVGGFIFSLSSRLDAAESRQDRQSDAIKEYRSDVVSMKVDLATVKEAVLYLKERNR